MATGGKRYKAQLGKVNSAKTYELREACETICSTASAKFDESVELALRLSVDPRKADQNIRGSVPLPHGLGKNVRVAVFAKGDKVKEAEQAGADFVGSDDLVEKVKGGFLDFDSVVATPDMMVQIGKIGKLLGPKGLMPSPKLGTVTFDIASTVKAIKGGRAEFQVDKEANVHCSVGKASFGGQKIYDNLVVLIDALNRAKPSTSKGVYLRTAFLSCSMGPSVKLDLAPVRAA